MNKLVVTSENTPGTAVAAWIDLRVMMVGCFAAASAVAYAAVAAPDWWSARGLIKSGVTVTVADYAMANQGQLKNMARAACNDLLVKGYIDLSDPINQQIQNWRTNTASAKDYAPVNLGQLKAVAKPIYDVLMAKDSSISYPWSSVASDDKDYAVANIGQLKHVFSFNIPDFSGVLLDSDGDGIPDAWEIAHGLNPNNLNDASLSLNRDGPTALENYLRWVADPNDATSGQLTITITAPVSGATL